MTENWRQAFIELLLPTGRVWRRAAGKAFSEIGVSVSAAGPILVIQRLGNGVRQNVIADEVGVDGAALVRSLDQLEQNGLVERRADPTDRRSKTLHLTESGRQLADSLLAVFNLFRDTSLDGISDADGEAALRVMKKLLENSYRELE